MNFMFFIAYFLLHFLLYAIWLRDLKLFASEKGIFFYHFISAAGTGLAVLGAAILELGDLRLAHAVIFISLHSIYSLSFLELWALADGGYSLSILDCIDANHGYQEDALLDELAKLGTIKKQSRVADLLRLGLIEERNEQFSLTPAGRRAASVLRTIVHIANVRMER